MSSSEELLDLPEPEVPYDKLIVNYFDSTGKLVGPDDNWVVFERIFRKDGEDVQRERYVVEPEKLQEDLGLGKPFEDRNDTGDQTFPNITNQPKDNYDMLNLETDGPVLFNTAVPPMSMDTNAVNSDVLELMPEEPGSPVEQKFSQLELQEAGESPAFPLPELVPVNLIKYVYNSKSDCKICKRLAGTVWNKDDKSRPILPSEGYGKGVVNTHPNCLCTWEDLGISFMPKGKEMEPQKDDKPLSPEVQKIADERKRITDEFLRPIGDGDFKLQEAMVNQILQEEFPWVPADARKRMRSQDNGRFLLVVASGPSITDHRFDRGEKYRRLWTEDLQKKMTYTAIGKGQDINHTHSKKNPDSGSVVDSEYNDKTHKMEMIIYEEDQEILDAIRQGIITEFSINTGKPRTKEVKCETGECFMVPSGTILGGNDGIAGAYVVTKKPGWMYNGFFIPATVAGVRGTKIYIIE